MKGLLAMVVGSMLLGCQGGVSSAVDARAAQLGINCEGTTNVKGFFTQSTAAPTGEPGCWPVGTWTFTSTMKSTSCSSQPQMDQQYQFSVARDADDNESYQILSPDHPEAIIRVTAAGGALCEGEFRYYSPDGKTVINLKPHLFANNTLSGQGQFAQYTADQRP
jgi:hypothetical protein